MKNNVKPIDKVNTKLTILITCAVLIVTSIISCSVDMATGIAYMKSLTQTTATSVPTSDTTYLVDQTTVITENTEVPAKENTSHSAISDNYTTSSRRSNSTTSSTAVSDTTSKKTESDSAVSSAQSQDEAPVIKENDGKYYITASGTKYHRSSCAYLKKSMIEISLDEAVEDGYKPCSKCIEQY